MSIIQAIILGIVQGLTEFLPVSSSGHLLILQKAMGVEEVGLTFDVALHIGTLVALLIYFHNDVWELAKSLVIKSEKTRLAWFIGAATIPAAVLGYLLESRAESTFRSPVLVAINLSVFGLIMLLAEHYAKRYKTPTKLAKVSLKQSMIMGFAQSIAIVPGVSRSGSTITAGLFAGLDRVAATRFSFLLGIPIISGAALKVLVSDTGAALISDSLPMFLTGIITAFLTGLLAIRFMLGYLSKHSLAAFAYYRFALAALIILIVSI